MRQLLLTAFFAATCLVAPAVQAGDAMGSFGVNIRLNESASGICISTTLSGQTNAIVRVTCQGGEFVSIEQRNGRPFVGTHGGTYRFSFTGIKSVPYGWLASDELYDWIGQGTITALRILRLTERDERLELLVSF